MTSSPELPRDGLARAATVFTILFAAAAPWSIAVAQTALVTTALLVVVRHIRGRRDVPPVPITLIAIGAYLGIQALSIPTGIHPAHSLRCYQGSWILLFPLLFWYMLQDPSRRRMALVTLFVSGALSGAYGVLQHFQGIDWWHGREVLENYGGGGYVSVGNLSSHLTYAGVQLPILFLGVGLALSWRGRRAALAWAAVAALGASVLFSFARTVWVGAAVGVALLAFGRGWRRGLAILAPVVLLLVLVVWMEPALRDRVTSIANVTDLPRWRLWQTAVRIVADHPLLGAGLGSFPALFPVYKVPGEYMATGHPHHDLLNAAVETGLVGALAWVSIWIAFFRDSRPVSERARWLTSAIRAGVLALLIAGLGQCFSTDEEVAQVWFFVMTAGLIESGLVTTGGRAPWKRLRRAFKARTLPIARHVFTRPRGAPTSSGHRARSLPARVLVVRPDDRLGNLLLLTPFLRRLREALPEARIGLLTGDVYAPLLRAWPWVDEWIVQDKRAHIRAPWTFVSWIRALRRRRSEWAFEMSNHNTHSYYSCLLTLASGAGERIGFDEPRNADTLTRAVPAPPATIHFSQAPLALLRAAGLPAEPAVMTCPLPPASGNAVDETNDDGAIVLHVGGRGGKALPAETWSAVLDRLLDACPSASFLLVAGPREEDRLPARAKAARVRVATGLGVVDLAHRLRRARVFVGCDTGVMHLAAAVGTATVSLFFRSNPCHYAPLGDAHTTVLLANPYGVTPSTWTHPAGGPSRGGLVIVPVADAGARSGRPVANARAVDAIVSAVTERSQSTVERVP